MRILIALLFCLPLFCADRYLVKWETQEKCYECSWTNAVLCTGPDPGCGIPLKTVAHYREFETLKDAVDFSNTPSASGLVTGTYLSVGTIYVTGSIPPEAPPMSAKQVVAIYRIAEVPIDKSVTRTEVPQPPKIEEKFTVRVKQ